MSVKHRITGEMIKLGVVVIDNGNKH